MAKKFTKLASRFRLSGTGLNNMSPVYVSKDAIFLVPSSGGATGAAVGAATGGLLGMAVGAAVDAHNRKKSGGHPLMRDLANLRVAREAGWPGPKKGPVFVIQKKKVTEWSISKMSGLVIKVAGQTAKIDVGLTGQGKARDAMKLYGWNSVKDGGPDADDYDEDEWAEEEDDDGGEWDEYEDDSAGHADEYDEYEEEEEWEEERPERRRTPPDRRRGRSPGGVGRSSRPRRRSDRKQNNANPAVMIGVKIACGLVGAVFGYFLISGLGGGGNRPAPPRPDNPIAAREEPVRPVEPNPVLPPGNRVADNDPIPATRPNDNAPIAAPEPPKKPDPIVSDNGRLKLLNSWGPLRPTISYLDMTPDGKLFVGHQERSIRVWKDPSAAPDVEWSWPSARMIDVSPDGQHVAVGSSGEFGVYRLEDGKQMWQGEARNPQPGAAWSPDGSRVAAYQTSDGLEVRNVAGETLWITGYVPDMTSINSMDFTPDGKVLVLMSSQKLRAYNADSGDIIDVKELERDFRSNCRVSAAGKIAVFPAYQGTRVFDFSEPPGVQRPGIGPPASNNNQLRLSTSGRIAGCLHQKTISIWDTSTGETIDVLTATGWTPSHFRISPDGRRVLLYTVDGYVQVWEIPALEESDI